MADILAGIENTLTQSSSSKAPNLSLGLVFAAVNLEKLSSPSYVLEKSDVEIAAFDRMGNSFGAVGHKNDLLMGKEICNEYILQCYIWTS